MQYISKLNKVEKPIMNEAAKPKVIDAKKLQARLMILQHAKREQMQYLNQVKKERAERATNNTLVNAFMARYNNIKQAA
jgi:hypothetical protein